MARKKRQKAEDSVGVTYGMLKVVRVLGFTHDGRYRIVEVRCNQCETSSQKRLDKVQSSWYQKNCPCLKKLPKGPKCECSGSRASYDRLCMRCRNQWLKYNLTKSDYDAMLLAQNGVCAFCQNPESIIDHRSKKTRMLATDHDHSTNRVRRLLCSACNTSYGKLNEDPAIIRRMLDAALADEAARPSTVEAAAE